MFLYDARRFGRTSWRYALSAFACFCALASFNGCKAGTVAAVVSAVTPKPSVPSIATNATVKFSPHTSESGGVMAPFGGQLVALISAKSPHEWHVESNMKNNSSTAVQVIPIYLFSEFQPNQHLENVHIIGPSAYKDEFSKTLQKSFMSAPSDLSGKVKEQADVPMPSLDKPFDFAPGHFLASTPMELQLAASLEVNGSATAWATTSVGPQGTVVLNWDTWGEWAAPQKVRLGTDFGSFLLGPVIVSGKQAYLGVITLKASDNPDAVRSEQSSFELKKMTPDFSKELLAEFPNSPSVEEFAPVVEKAAGNQK